MSDAIRAGIVGTGWMALVHTEALRRIGVDVVGMVGSSPARTRAKANPLLPPPFDSLDELLAVPGLQAVHITSPNDVHAAQAGAVIDAGLAVVCEKPLGVDTAETAELVERAHAAGVVNAVCFNLRYYAQNQNAAAEVAAGTIGTPRLVSGHYLQDWLLLETDWNWRLDAERQGTLRAMADIGSHWIDLTGFVTGQEVTEVFADLHTFVGERDRPTGEVETFAAATVGSDVERTRVAMASDDAAGLLLRYDGGARGVCTVSQVSAGRKNDVSWEVDGADAALAWQSTDPERLWIGHRGRANELAEKDPAVMTAAGIAAAAFPAGHVEGYPDTFRALFGAVYSDIAAGAPSTLRRTRRSPPGTASSPCAKRSHNRRAPAHGRRSRRRPAFDPQITITKGAPDEARPADRRVPRHSARRGGRVGQCQRIRMPGGGVLATGRGSVAPLRRGVAHRLRPPLRAPRRRSWSTSSPSGASRSRRSGTTPTRSPPTARHVPPSSTTCAR